MGETQQNSAQIVIRGLTFVLRHLGEAIKNCLWLMFRVWKQEHRSVEDNGICLRMCTRVIRDGTIAPLTRHDSFKCGGLCHLHPPATLVS